MPLCHCCRRAERLPENFHNRRIYAEFLELAGGMLLEHWRESPGMSMVSARGALSPSTIRPACAAPIRRGRQRRRHHSTPTGRKHTSRSARIMPSPDGIEQGWRGAVLCEFYNMYSPSPEHAARFARHLMHGECFYNFSSNKSSRRPASPPSGTANYPALGKSRYDFQGRPKSSGNTWPCRPPPPMSPWWPANASSSCIPECSGNARLAVPPVLPAPVRLVVGPAAVADSLRRHLGGNHDPRKTAAIPGAAVAGR